jgi:hypothetical protein
LRVRSPGWIGGTAGSKPGMISRANILSMSFSTSLTTEYPSISRSSKDQDS